MFSILLFKDIRFFLMTFRFAAAMVTVTLLVLTSMWILGDDYARRRDAYNTSAEESARRDREESYVPSQIMPTLHRPPAALSIFAQGEDRRFGNTLTIRRWIVPQRTTGSFTDNMLLAAQPAFDLYTIVAVVLSLFAVLLTYDGVSGEREEGTLKLQSSLGAGRAAIYTAKFTGAVICLAIPLLIGLAAGLILLQFTMSIGFGPDHYLAILLMAVASMLYAAVFAALGLLSSALLRRSSAALVLALLLWTVGVLLIPEAAQNAGDNLVPLPSPTELTNLDKATAAEAVKALDGFAERYPNYPYGMATGNFGFGDGGGSGAHKFDGQEINFREAEEYVRFYEPYMIRRAETLWDAFKKHYAEKERQAALADLLSLPAPIHHLRLAFNALAGTGYPSYYEFMEACRRYRRTLLSALQARGYFGDNALAFFTRRPRSEINDDLFSERAPMNMAAYEAKDWTKFGPESWGPLPPDETPPFAYTDGRPGWEQVVAPMAMLAAFIAALFLAGLVAFQKYDIR